MIYSYKLYETSKYNDVYIESGKETIKTLFNKIEDHLSKIVNNFNDRWERNDTDKIIKHLKKSKNIKIKIAPGIDERVKNYIDLKNQYKKTISNPSEENAKKLNDDVEKSKKKRKRIIFGATATVSVSSIIAYLLLLKHRNTTSDFTLNDIKKNIPDEIFNTDTELENLKTSYSKERDERNSYYTKMRNKSKKEYDEWNNNIDKFKSLWDTLKASKNASNELEASQKELYDEMMNALRNSSENLQNIHDINMTVMNIN